MDRDEEIAIEEEKPQSMWVIYRYPADYPGFFVARRHEILPNKHHPTEDHYIHRQLPALRRHVQRLLPGSILIPRDSKDNPVIVESWL